MEKKRRGFWEWMFSIPLWLSTFIIVGGVLTLIVGISTPFIIQSVETRNSRQEKCESRGGEMLQATGKGGKLVCIQRGIIIDMKGE